VAKRGRRPPARPKNLSTVAPTPAARSPSKIELIFWAALFVVAVGAVLWNHHALFFLSWTDEQIHFYVARRVAEGARLYRDIDSSRPPLAIFPVAWLISLGCTPLFAGRALVVGSQLATAGLLLWAGRCLFSWRVGALAALLFLTSPEVFDRIHYTGIQLVALTTAACVFFSLAGWPLLSGLFLGLTLATDQHGLVICGIVAVLTVIRSPRDGLRFTAGALIVPAIVFGSVWLMGARHVWNSLVGHHLYHLSSGPSGNERLWEKFSPWLYEHGYLFLVAVVALVVRGHRRSGARDADADEEAPRSRSVRVLAAGVAIHVAVVTMMTDAIFLYVVVIAPLLALLAGIGLDAAFVAWSEGRRSKSAEARRGLQLTVAGVATLVAVMAAGWSAARSNRESLDEHPYSFWPHRLHAQVAERQRLDVAGRVAKDLALPGNATIFGDPTIVSAVALQQGRRVSAELVDLDTRWLEAGTVSHQDVVARIERDHVGAIVTSPWFLAQVPYFRAYIMSCYQVPQTFPPPEDGPGSGLFEIVVYRHNPGDGPCSVSPGVSG
jgi:hypothetical protein